MLVKDELYTTQLYIYFLVKKVDVVYLAHNYFENWHDSFFTPGRLYNYLFVRW